MINKDYDLCPREIVDIENVEKVDIKEVKIGEKADLEVIIDSADSQIDIENKVRERLVRDNWYLQNYWKRKGIPQEQLYFKAECFKDSDSFELYNFGQKISEHNKMVLQEGARIFAQFGIFKNKINYILIDNNQLRNPYTGEEKKGNGAQSDRAIIIYPNALKQLPYRIEGVGNFEGTIIHEFAHSICDNFINDWKRQFGWEMLDEPEKMAGGAFRNYINKNPKRCVNDYANNSPEEDFCESVVAFLKNQQKLDQEKADFIKNIFDKAKQKKNKNYLFEAESISNVHLPKIKQPVKYITKTIDIKIF